MMKKRLLAMVTAVGIVALILVACGRNPSGDYYDYSNFETNRMPEKPVLDDAPDYADYGGTYGGYEHLEALSFTIEIVGDDDLDGLDEFIEHEYLPERFNNFGGDNILIRVNQPISDFTLLKLQEDYDGEFPIVVTERIENIGEITPDRPLLIKSFLWSGSALPRQGFSFIDVTGHFNYYQWSVSPMDGTLNWSMFHWSPEYGLHELGYQY